MLSPLEFSYKGRNRRISSPLKHSISVKKIIIDSLSMMLQKLTKGPIKKQHF